MSHGPRDPAPSSPADVARKGHGTARSRGHLSDDARPMETWPSIELRGRPIQPLEGSIPEHSVVVQETGGPLEFRGAFLRGAEDTSPDS